MNITAHSITYLTATTLILVALLTGCGQHRSIHPYHHQSFDLGDKDTDGVIDVRDQCQKTPEGSRISHSGCPSFINQIKYQKAVIYFTNASARISPDQLSALQDLAQVLRDDPSGKLTIKGYASLPGKKAFNLHLSRQRAYRVRNELINHFNVNPDQIVVHWYGEEQPAVSASSSEADPLNRRATLFLTYTTNQPVRKWSADTFSEPAFQ